MTKDLYIFSGLGADERVFQKLDLSGFRPTFIKWILPHGGESVEHYEKRLPEQIKAEKPTLICLSFGGMMVEDLPEQV